MFLKLKDILRKEDYKVTDKEVEKAFLETGYHPEQKKHNLTKNYYFENIDNLVEHILFQFPEIRPLKLQKGLYFLFAFYINTYYVKPQIETIETGYEFPKHLFKADFEAWTYGPVVRRQYSRFKRFASEFILGDFEQNLKLTPLNPIILELFQVNVFTLVELSTRIPFWIENHDKIKDGISDIKYDFDDI